MEPAVSRPDLPEVDQCPTCGCPSDCAEGSYQRTLGLVRDYRQALWDIYGILGFDQDGDKTPDTLVHPPLIQLVKEAAEQFRKDYDDACEEAV